MPAAESFPKRATVCGRQKSVTLPEERRRFAALLRPLSWLPKKPESQPPTESLQDEKRVGHKREEQDTPVAATRSRTPMPQDFTMCDASRICCESVWRFGSFFFFFFNFYFILHWLLAFFLAYFWVLRPKMSIYRKNTCKQTWLCAKPIHYPYAMYGMRIFFDCAHISWRTCSWPCLRKLAKGVGPKCVEEYSN